jgi:hypothetical protein
MEKRKFRTLIKGEHSLGRNKHVSGRISGIAYVILEEKPLVGFANVILRNGDEILTNECTEAQYEKFTKIVEELYPELCIFDC